MTYPPQHDGYAQPQYEQPQYEQPQYEQPQYEQPRYDQSWQPQGAPAGYPQQVSSPPGGYPQQVSSPPGGYPQQPYYPVAPQPKKSRVGLVIGIIAGVVVLGCGAIVAVGALAGGSTSGGSGTSGKKYGLNEPARDGDFEFVVKSVTCGKAKEGDADLNKTAQGQYCEVAVTVKNIGKDQQIFDGGPQKAKGSTGATYGDDAEAEIYANSSDQTFLNQINPGNTADGLLIFDIPKDAKIVSLELHDSSFSGGVTVTVS